ncbi:HBL007Wp [Eremothecium sinecaudum]|uniref:HBL007Wp n=1 Tax=Eremothecium sinecaudum TaxID=45286 RepID=A0A125RDY2_9SACH|nr:HBL007Wp [Eremothecium sinecaudum]AMD18895.1 HBL007Wp [Eremothecium sinecaudum]
MTSLLISLTHFCDKHGPKVLLVTQCAKTTSECEKLLLPNYPTDSYCESCQIYIPGEYNCKSMRSVINGSHYVSTHYSAVRFQFLASLIKKIFSEETVSYDESPLLFYDNTKGLNLSVGFKLEDPYARGNERRYCLVLTIDTRNQDLAMDVISKNWKFISGAFSNMIEFIKRERKDEMLRILKQNEEPGSTFSTMVSGSYLRGNSLKIPKNLTELTNDQNLFVRLHKWNAFTLDRLDKQINEHGI